MTTTQAISAYGVILMRNGVAVGEITEIGDLEIKMANEDVTPHGSLPPYAQKIGTKLDAGQVQITGNFLPGDAGQQGMKTDMEARTLQNFSIVFPPAITARWDFTAFVSSWKIPALTVDKSVTWVATLEISGQPVMTVGASTGLTTPFFSTDFGSIVPAPANATYNYVCYIPTAKTASIITPTAAAGVITITANGVSQVVTSGTPATAIALGVAGTVTIATITVQETGKVPATYYIHLARALT